MRLLLTHGYFIAEDPKEQKIMKPYVPLGILYLSSHLRAQGFEVEIYDSTFGTLAELISLLQRGPAGVLGIYGNLMTRPNVLRIMAAAKEAGWITMLGGPEPANYAGEFLAAGADLIVKGEAENSLEQLMLADFARTAWPTIPGLIFQTGNGLADTGSPRLLEDLDAQPWPDRERVDIPRYLRTWREHHGKSSISVITARGCPYRCNWCSHSVYGHSHRRRSPAAVAAEIEWILDRHQPDMLWMADDVFTIHHGWLEKYADELARRRITIPFECITRADRINEGAADLLARLNCSRVWIGSESGSQRILDAMQRGVTLAQVQQAVSLCKARGIETGMFLMWGYDGEQVEDVEATVGLVKLCRPDVFLTTISYPIKGTPYFEKVADRVVPGGAWRETTDREATIRGRHSRNFYRYADDLLRSEMANVPDAARIADARRNLTLTAAEVEV
ncbi:MAG TPA: radical SAM protein [Bryobacteraceae bacterium]|nr:radical SAM protein [Bryobacteraceae bacterium]